MNLFFIKTKAVKNTASTLRNLIASVMLVLVFTLVIMLIRTRLVSMPNMASKDVGRRRTSWRYWISTAQHQPRKVIP